jgi:hypothetical protein
LAVNFAACIKSSCRRIGDDAFAIRTSWLQKYVDIVAYCYNFT